MPITPKQAEEIASLLADQIIHKGESTQDKTQCLIAAITAMYGSLDMFYEQFFKLLDSKTLQAFGSLVDQALEKKKQAQHNFAAIIVSDAFKKIVKNFAKVKTSLAGEANHALPLSPYTTAIPLKPDTAKGKQEKGI